MTDKKETGKKTLGLSGKTLSLGGGGARPSAPMGRGGGAIVEVRRKRTATITPKTTQDPAPKNKPTDDASRLTEQEKEARARVVREAAEGASVKKTILPKRRTTIESKAAEAKDKAAEQREKELKELNEIEADEVKKAADTQAAAPAAPSATDSKRPKTFNNENLLSAKDRLKKVEQPKQPSRPRSNTRRGGRITITQALNNDFGNKRGPSLSAQKRAREKARLAGLSADPVKKVFREVVLPESITVQELANRMTESTGDVVKALMKMGVMATMNEVLDADTAELIIEEFGHTIKRVTDADVEIGVSGDDDDKPEDLLPRPPVVTIMGHVDHGKTSLLDAMRQTDVVAREAGGITQHIGAYQIKIESGETITFLDTPGHAAFTEMRARGANVTDIVIVVVGANDSVMPQTIEAIHHAKAAEVPIIIAINKIDLPDANPDKVKQDLLQHEIVIEDMGGDVLCLEVSAKKKTNLDKLQEMILLQSEVLEIKANPNRKAQGAVIESKLEKGRGAVATVLIQRGTLRVGDVFVAGAEFGKVRAIIDDKGNNIKEAFPGQPVEVLGLNASPNAGDQFSVVDGEARAREITNYRQHKNKQNQAASAVQGRTTMDQLLEQRAAGEKTTLPIIIKADVHGSYEAIAGSMHKITEENEDVVVQILHHGVGGITESDVKLAQASNCPIIGFNVRANAQARELAEKEGVSIRYYNIIYNVIDDIKAMLSGMLSPAIREEYIGQAKILEVFNITKVGKIAGCMVEMGNVKRGSKVRLLRDDVVIHEGTLKTLKRHKDEVKEVKEGTECGMAFETYDDLKEGDMIECFDIIEEARSVE